MSTPTDGRTDDDFPSVTGVWAAAARSTKIRLISERICGALAASLVRSSFLLPRGGGGEALQSKFESRAGSTYFLRPIFDTLIFLERERESDSEKEELPTFLLRGSFQCN